MIAWMNCGGKSRRRGLRGLRGGIPRVDWRSGCDFRVSGRSNLRIEKRWRVIDERVGWYHSTRPKARVSRSDSRRFMPSLLKISRQRAGSRFVEPERSSEVRIPIRSIRLSFVKPGIVLGFLARFRGGRIALTKSLRDVEEMLIEDLRI